MANMSYCRFRNTLEDLRDAEKGIHEESDDADEERAWQRLIALCKKIAHAFSDSDE